MSTRTHDAVVELSDISKTFGGTRVLDAVGLRLMAGEVHSLVGMNGSGKSTLIKIMAGVHKPDAGGTLRFETTSDGAEVAASGGPEAATSEVHHAEAVSAEGRTFLRRSERDVHIGFVHQDLGLVDTFSITDNFALALGYDMSPIGSVRRQRISEITRAGLERVDVHVDPEIEVGSLGAADRSLVAIARALTQLLGHDRPCLVLDEPTAALPRKEVERVLRVVRSLADEGAAVLFVSHNLAEVTAISDRITVLRDGKVVANAPAPELSSQQIVDAMLGESAERALQEQQSRKAAEERLAARATAATHDGPPTLRVRGLTGTRVFGLDLEIEPGEIVALTGLVGCGKSEVGRMIAGSATRESGDVELEGKSFHPKSSRAAIAEGVSYVPAERLRRGGILDFTARENISLPVLDRFWSGGRVRSKPERSSVEALMVSTQVRPMAPEQLFASFSGGNQQKIVLSRALISDPRVLVVDEPTQGVDVGAIPILYDRIRAVADSGAAVLVITSSYDEVVELADRAVVLDRGQVCARLAGDELTVAALVGAGFGERDERDVPTHSTSKEG